MNCQEQEITISVKAESDEVIGMTPVTLTGKKTISAFVYSGTLALFEVSFSVWNITHIPTGLKLMEVRVSKHDAEIIIGHLLQADWNFGEFGSQSLLELMPEETRRVFLEAWKCRSGGWLSAVEIRSLAAASLGHLGGRSKSLEKAQAARENGRKGGRPPGSPGAPKPGRAPRDTNAFD